MYLLDTNVVSEMIKRAPNKKVTEVLFSIDSRKLFISVLSLGEIRKGIEKAKDPTYKQRILYWLEVELLEYFRYRIINVDASIADKWGYISAIRSISQTDALLAATAIVHNYKLVTRNVKDFEDIGGLELINPWEM